MTTNDFKWLLFLSPTDFNPRNKLETSLLPLVYFLLMSLKYSQKAMLAKKLDHALLTELLERGQRNTGMVESIVLFSNRIWNCTKYSERTAGVAAAEITQDNDDRQEGGENLRYSTLLRASTLWNTTEFPFLGKETPSRWPFPPPPSTWCAPWPARQAPPTWCPPWPPCHAPSTWCPPWAVSRKSQEKCAKKRRKKLGVAVVLLANVWFLGVGNVRIWGW